MCGCGVKEKKRPSRLNGRLVNRDNFDRNDSPVDGRKFFFLLSFSFEFAQVEGGVGRTRMKIDVAGSDGAVCWCGRRKATPNNRTVTRPSDRELTNNYRPALHGPLYFSDRSRSQV